MFGLGRDDVKTHTWGMMGLAGLRRGTNFFLCVFGIFDVISVTMASFTKRTERIILRLIFMF